MQGRRGTMPVKNSSYTARFAAPSRNGPGGKEASPTGGKAMSGVRDESAQPPKAGSAASIAKMMPTFTTERASQLIHDLEREVAVIRRGTVPFLARAARVGICGVELVMSASMH